MRIKGDTITFRNGREEYANCGIIGLSPDGNVSGGYDDGFGYSNEMEGQDGLSKKERVELAEHMIIEWKKFGGKDIKE